jgi:hypothetical protein
VNWKASSGWGCALLSEIPLASATVLAAFCALEIALPRAGRAAAGLLLRHDSEALRAIEKAGVAAQEPAWEGILFSALLAAATVVLAIKPRGGPRFAAAVAIAVAIGWVFARQAERNPVDAWVPLLGGAAVAGAGILASLRGASDAGAAVLQAGLAFHAAWALLVASGRAAVPALERASEALVLGGIAAAGIGAWRPGLGAGRTVLAAALLAGLLGAAAAFPGPAHAVVRHLFAAGTSGLPFVVTAGLLAAALAGLVVATGARGLAAPLIVALVCARRPEPWLVVGALASSLLLLRRAGEQDSGRTGARAAA